METKGKFFWKKRYYSICSIHGLKPNSNCSLCKRGGWYNVWNLNISSFFHEHFTRVWCWWQNNI